MLLLLQVDSANKERLSQKNAHPEHTATGQNCNQKMNAQTVLRECFVWTLV
jgi:hypothetical protein